MKRFTLAGCLVRNASMLSTAGLERDHLRRRNEKVLQDDLLTAVVHVIGPGAQILRNASSGGLFTLRAADLQLPVSAYSYLGRLDGQPQFAVSLSLIPAVLRDTLFHGAELVGLRAAMTMDGASWTPAQLNILATAAGLSAWQESSVHCGKCGVRTLVTEAGHKKVCSGCGSVSFPRTDPAVIMLVTDGDRCVLGRQTAWAAGRYSALAGFVEPGESLEDAVAREVLEEVGLMVDHMEYHGSQPWPFPQSLMLGFECRLQGSDTLHVNHDELEDARWFTRKQLLDGVVSLPPPSAIANELISRWLSRT